LISGERCPQCGGEPVGGIPPTTVRSDGTDDLATADAASEAQPTVVEETTVHITVEDGATLELDPSHISEGASSE